MARSVPRRHPIRLVRDALQHPIAREVLGRLSEADLKVLADADAAGQLGSAATPILQAADPATAARQQSHPVARVLAKLDNVQLRGVADLCPPAGCDH